MIFIQKFRLPDGMEGCDARAVNTSGDIEVPVLIVGRSLVGLTVSGLLASQGVPGASASGPGTWWPSPSAERFPDQDIHQRK